MKLEWVTCLVYLKGQSEFYCRNQKQGLKCICVCVSQVVEKALQRSMSRMQVDSLDCVQFHWWDYRDKRYLDALGHLSDLQQEGLIRM